jgi:hypothetical protein
MQWVTRHMLCKICLTLITCVDFPWANFTYIHFEANLAPLVAFNILCAGIGYISIYLHHLFVSAILVETRICLAS